MRIALVYDATYPYVKGGGERRYYEVGRRLAQQHDVSLVSFGWWGSQAPVESGSNLRYVSVGAPRDLYRNDGTRSATEPVWFGAKVLPTLLRHSFDVIDCCAFPYFSVLAARTVAAMRRSALVVTWLEHWGGYWFDYWGWKGVFGQVVELAALAASPRAIAISEFTRARLLHGPFKRSPSTVSVVPNGIDFAKINAIDSDVKEFDVIFVGRLMPHKRVDLLLRALANLQVSGLSLRCRIIGDGPERIRLESLAAKLAIGNSTEFTGFMPEHEMLRALKAARVLVLPSEREGLGNIVLEANACGVPVVVVRTPESASSEIVHDGVTGRLCDLSDSAVAAAIAEILESRSRFRPEDCMSHARTFDWDDVAVRVLEVYDTAAANR